MNAIPTPAMSSVSLAKVVTVADFVDHVNGCHQCMNAPSPHLLCTLGRSLDVAMLRTESDRLDALSERYTCGICLVDQGSRDALDTHWDTVDCQPVA